MNTEEIRKFVEKLEQFLEEQTEGHCPYCGDDDYPVKENEI